MKERGEGDTRHEVRSDEKGRGPARDEGATRSRVESEQEKENRVSRRAWQRQESMDEAVVCLSLFQCAVEGVVCGKW